MTQKNETPCTLCSIYWNILAAIQGTMKMEPTPRWIRPSVLPISRCPSGLNAACHFRTLSVLPAWEVDQKSMKALATAPQNCEKKWELKSRWTARVHSCIIYNDYVSYQETLGTKILVRIPIYKTRTVDLLKMFGLLAWKTDRNYQQIVWLLWVWHS